MARQFNSKNSSTSTGYRVVYEDAIDVLTHLASLDGSNPPAKELLINHIPPRIAGAYGDWGTDEPEELQEMHGDEGLDEHGQALSSGYTEPDTGDLDPDMHIAPDNAATDPETAAALKEQEAMDFLEEPEVKRDKDPDLSGEVETCQTCRGDSVHNELGNEFYFEDHCPVLGQNCTCGDGEYSPNSSPHCRGIHDHAKCPGKEKYEWQLVDEKGEKITDICPDCGNTGVVPIGHSYGEEFESHANNAEEHESISSKPEVVQPEHVTEVPETNVKPTPGVNSFEDEPSEMAPKAKTPARAPIQTGADTLVPLGSFDKALKLREQLRNAEEQRQSITPKQKEEEVTHNNCGCASRGGDLTDDQFRTVMQSDEGRQAIDQVKRKYLDEGATEDERQSTGMTDTQLRQQAIGNKMVELKRCPGDEALSKIGGGVK